MPTYVYSCQKCGDFECWQDINTPSNEYPPCPDCGGTRVAKVFIAPAVTFMGEGFYSTDNRGKKRRSGP